LWQLRAESDESVGETHPFLPTLFLFYPFGGKAEVLNLVFKPLSYRPIRPTFIQRWYFGGNPRLKTLTVFQNTRITKDMR
jgi:hypothetical protein